MTIKLYTTTDSQNVVNKTLTPVETLTGTLKGNTDLLNPVVDIEYSSFGFNYVYIQEFNRYYFVTSIKSLSNSLIQLVLHVDVLMSYASTIKGLSGYVTRSASDYNADVVDPMQVLSNGSTVEYKDFSLQPVMAPDDPADAKKDLNYILTVIGGTSV